MSDEVNKVMDASPGKRLSRLFILFAAAVRQATSGESLTKKLGMKVTDAQADALRFLALNDNVTIGEISLGLGHTISGATKAINRLEKNGWVMRFHGGADHREVYVRLTEVGKEMADALLKETEERMRRILWKLRSGTVERLEIVLEEFLRDYIDDENVANKLCVACGFERGINCCASDIDCVVAKTIRHLENGQSPHNLF